MPGFDLSLRLAAISVDELLPALGLIYGHLSPGDAVAMSAAGVQQIEQDPALLGGFLGAFRGDRLVGAVWAQQQPGRIVMLSGPTLVEDEPESTWNALLEAAESQFSRESSALAQTLLTHNDAASYSRFLSRDYKHIADLAYLVSLAESFPAERPALPFELDHFRDTDEDRVRLATLLDATYVETRDCPALNGAREPADVLDGYRAGGVFAPERWLFVRYRNQDVGCLLLADYPEHDQWELVYVSLTPAARGKGWGFELTRYAQWLAKQAGRARLVLAVDESNDPAMRMYAMAGFVGWNRRIVLCKAKPGIWKS